MNAAPEIRMDWNEANVATLRRLVEEANLSASQIAAELGCTRNAVIGKVSRLKLGPLRGGRSLPPGRPAAARQRRLASSTRRAAGTKPARPAKASALSFVGAFATEATRERHAEAGREVRTSQLFSPAGAPQGARIVPLEELEGGQCKWPLFDERPFVFCGADAAPVTPDGKQPPYCPFHAKRARSRLA